MDFLPEVVDNFEPDENDLKIKAEVTDVSDDDEDVPSR